MRNGGAGLKPGVVREPLLARAVDTVATSVRDRPGEGRRPKQLKEPGDLLAGGVGEGRCLTRGEEGEGPVYQDSNTLFDGLLVCPGCARSGVRGGVRNRGNSNDARAASTKAKVPAVGSTFHTSLGVVVDTCLWWRRSGASLSGMADGDRVAGSDEFCSEGETGTPGFRWGNGNGKTVRAALTLNPDSSRWPGHCTGPECDSTPPSTELKPALQASSVHSSVQPL